MLTKELGDLRKIALSLEEMAGINSAEISPKVGDLRRIADALENLDISSGGGSGEGGKMPHLELTFVSNGVITFNYILSELFVPVAVIGNFAIALDGYAAEGSIPESVNFLYGDAGNGQGMALAYITSPGSGSATIEHSNEVNCSVQTMDGVSIVLIDDITSDSAITLTLIY